MPKSTPKPSVVYGKVALVRLPNAGHPKVRRAMERSGWLIEDGFQSSDRDTVALIVRPPSEPAGAVERLTTELEKLIASGEIRA